MAGRAGDPVAMSRREIWMLAGIGFNTIASLTAIALWALAPPRGGPMKGLPGEAAVSAASIPPLPTPPMPPPRRPSTRMGRGMTAQPGNEPGLEAPEVGSRLSHKRSEGAAVATSVTELGERLHLNPQVLALQLGDEHGEVPKLWAERLERGFKTGEDLARRLGLDEGRAQSLVALFTYYVFSELREEKAAPSGVDPERLEALSDGLLDDVRSACGEDAAAAAKSALAGL